MNGNYYAKVMKLRMSCMGQVTAKAERLSRFLQVNQQQNKRVMRKHMNI